MTSLRSTLRAISMEEFACLPPSQKVIVHDHARRFSALELVGSQQSVAMSWRSDAIDPVLVVGDRSEIWVGVDQRVACICDDGRIVVSLGLASSVLDVRCFSGCVVVLCETEAVVFNRDYSIRVVRGFVDVPCDVLEQDGKLLVVFEDGRLDSLE